MSGFRDRLFGQGETSREPGRRIPLTHMLVAFCRLYRRVRVSGTGSRDPDCGCDRQFLRIGEVFRGRKHRRGETFRVSRASNVDFCNQGTAKGERLRESSRQIWQRSLFRRHRLSLR